MRLLTKELAIKLLDWYKESLKMMEKAQFGWRKTYNIAANRYVDEGICFCAHKQFKSDVFNCDIISKYCPDVDYYWCTPIYECKNVTEMLQSMRNRISILETIIANEFN